MSTKSLILIDLENEWQDPESDYYVGDLSDYISRINVLIDRCRDAGYKIFFVRHVEKDGTTAFIEGTKNTQLLEGLHKDDNDIVITKYAISAFYNTDLEKELEGTADIVIAGILTNLCVRSAVSDAYDRGFTITIVSDCCTAFDAETHEFTLRDLKSTREEIEITDLDNLVV